MPSLGKSPHGKRKLLLLGYVIVLIAVYCMTRVNGIVNYHLSLKEHLQFYGWLPHNYMPFSTILHYFSTFPDPVALFNLLSSLAAMLPFGILLPWASARCRKAKWFFPVCALFCAGIEVVQRVTLTGIFDVDDILLSLAGCGIGFAVYQTARFLKDQKPHNQAVIKS